MIEFVFSRKDIRKKAIYLILSLLLSGLISAKLYVKYISDFYLIPPSDLEGLKEYFMSGSFIIAFLILFMVYKFFHSVMDFILFGVFSKITHNIYLFFRDNVSKEELLEDLNGDDLPPPYQFSSII